MSADEDDVAAYLRELEAATVTGGLGSSGSEGSLGSLKPKFSRFTRKTEETSRSPDSSLVAGAKVRTKNAASSVAPSENVTTVLQKFMKLEQKYSKKPGVLDDKEDSSLSLTSSRSASFIQPPPTQAQRRSSLKSTPIPAAPTETSKSERRVTFGKNHVADNDESSPSPRPTPTQPDPPVRRFSLSMEEIHSIEELETSESERSPQQPVVELARKEQHPAEVLLPERPKCSTPVGGHVRGLAVDLPSPEIESRPAPVNVVVVGRPENSEPRVPQPPQQVMRILRETSTQTIETNDDRKSVLTSHTEGPSFRFSSLDVRKYIDPNFVNVAEEDPAKTLVKHLMDMHVGMIASNIRRQSNLYQNTVDCLQPDHRYTTLKPSRSKQ